MDPRQELGRRSSQHLLTIVQQQHTSDAPNDDTTTIEEKSHQTEPSMTIAATVPQHFVLSDMFYNARDHLSETVNRRARQLRKRLKTILQGKEGRHINHEVNDPLLETLNYDNYEDYIHEVGMKLDPQASKMNRQLFFMRMLVTLGISLLCALCAFFMLQSVRSMFDVKTSVVSALWTQDHPVLAWLAMIGITTAFATVSAVLCVFVAPHARGGFIPYVIAYLQGTNVAHLFTWQTVFVKIVALTFTLAAGLPFGQDIFIGCGIGMWVVQNIHHLLLLSPMSKVTHLIRSVNEERIFITGSIAAGLAAFSSAPIAGVIYTMHYSASFLTTVGYGRAFVCALFAKFFADMSARRFSDKIRPSTVIDVSPDQHPPDYTWELLELFNFIILGLLGGLFGAANIWINVRLAKWRAAKVHHSKTREMLEVWIIAVCVASIWFALTFLFGCRQRHEQCDDESRFIRCPQLFCPSGYYAEMGGLTFSLREQATHMLFDRSVSPANEMSIFVPLVYALSFLGMFTVSYGAYLPGGPLLPNIAIGGAFGRAFGIFLSWWFPLTRINPGVYAMLGAGAFMGGYSRMHLPMVILLIEMTGDSTYMLPLMLSVVVAKWVSEYFVPYTYTTQHMALEKIPVVGENLPKGLEALTVADIMKSNTTALKEISTIAEIVKTLYKYRHTMIPVVDDQGQFEGLISRRSVIFALKYMPFYDTRQDAEAAREFEAEKIQGGQTAATMYQIDEELTSWKDTTDHALTLNEELADRLYYGYINLMPFVDRGPLICREATPVKRAHTFFRKVGVSHVPVLDQNGRLLAVLTRRNLVSPTAPKPVYKPRPKLLGGIQTINLHAPRGPHVEFDHFSDSDSEPSSAASSPREGPHREQDKGAGVPDPTTSVRVSTPLAIMFTEAPPTVPPWSIELQQVSVQAPPANVINARTLSPSRAELSKCPIDQESKERLSSQSGHERRLSVLQLVRRSSEPPAS